MKTRHQNRNGVNDRRFEKRAGRTNRHHLTNKCKGGTIDNWNIINLDMTRHTAWHLLFKNLSLPEVIILLQRLHEMKERERMFNDYERRSRC